MKIVLDTNVIVSGLLTSGGNPAQVLTLALSGAVQICHDHRIIAEYAEVLRHPRFKFNPTRIREILANSKSTVSALTPGHTQTWICPIRTTNAFWQWLSPDQQTFW